jgi:aspartyl-tRNA(Asn)/glutamyl-tRNA(Gln) amidotransferase subunit B
MRAKEDADDYRYFPDPDLPVLVVDAAWRDRVGASLPELPDARRARFVESYGLREMDAAVLTATRELSDYYEDVARVSGDPVTASNWVQSEVLAVLKTENLTPRRLRVTGAQLGALVALVGTGEISGKIGKTVFAEMVRTGEDPATVISEKGLSMITDRAAIEALAERVLDESPGQVAAFFGGKETIIKFLFGRMMARTGGRVDPTWGQRILREVLETRRPGT